VAALPYNDSMLKVSQLAKSLPGGRRLFSALDLSIERGEWLAISGESGTGKSTLLNLIAGLDAPDAGRMALDGVRLDTMDDATRTRHRRDHMGFVFQAFHLLPHLSIHQNIVLPLALQGHDQAKALTRAAELLEALGLAGRGNEYPGVLSGGEMQRVAVARALAHRPALILADEPTGNLDPDTAGRVLHLLLEQAREHNAAVLLVTHSVAAAAQADRCLHLDAQGLHVVDTRHAHDAE